MPGGGAVESGSRERERAAVIGLALSGLVNEDDVRAQWSDAYGAAFPSLDESLATLADLTAKQERLSQRVLSLLLLTKVSSQRGVSRFDDVSSLRGFVQAQVDEGHRLATARAARAEAASTAEAKAKAAAEAQAEEERRAAARAAADAEAKARAAAAAQLQHDSDEEAAARAAAAAERAAEAQRQAAALAAERAAADHPQAKGGIGDPPARLRLQLEPGGGRAASPRRAGRRGGPAPAMAKRPAKVTTKAPAVAGLTDPDPDVRNVYAGLQAASGAAPGGVESPWQAFTADAGGPLNLSADELNAPMCSDQEHVSIGGVDSTRVVTWFASDLPADKFSDWTDPRRWHLDCSLFYDGMTTKAKLAPTQQDFSVEFEETVRLTSTMTLVTPLVFTRTVIEPDLFAVHFALPHGVVTDRIHVDTGALIARHDPEDPSPRKTVLTAEKCIAFADPAMRSWPSMCCDLFWTELTITAALGCAQDEA